MGTKRNLELLCMCILTLAYLTSQQRSDSATTLTISTTSATLIYFLLRRTRLLHPPPGTLTPALESEWRSRIVSTVFSTALAAAGLLCLHGWKDLSHRDAWSVAINRIISYLFGPYRPESAIEKTRDGAQDLMGTTA